MNREVMRCYFCEEKLKEYPDCRYGSDEHGEFWSESMQRSVLAHPDCLPMGIDATIQGLDPEWKMA